MFVNNVTNFVSFAKINQPTAFFSYITKAKQNYFKLHGTIILQQLFTIPTKTKNDFKLRF